MHKSKGCAREDTIKSFLSKSHRYFRCLLPIIHATVYIHALGIHFILFSALSFATMRCDGKASFICLPDSP